MFWLNRGSYDISSAVVLVTGAGSGIGAALASLLHQQGACVVLVDSDDIGLKSVAESLGGRVLTVVADVRDRVAMAAAVDEATGQFGRLDVVVANAGIAPSPATVRTVDPVEFDRVIDINLTGAFNTIHPALDQIARHHGYVVIVSSVGAFVPGAGLAAYAMSKAAVDQLARSLRVELAGTGAAAGVVHFGFVRTPLMQPIHDDPLGRKLDAMMPWPLNRKISAEQAARVLADAIAHRRPDTVAPTAWLPYALLRGALNVLVDNRAAASRTVQDLIRTIEQRTQVSR